VDNVPFDEQVPRPDRGCLRVHAMAGVAVAHRRNPGDQADVADFSRNQTNEQIMSDQIERQIRARAHELWEAAGKPEGREHEFWYQAERELKGEATDNSDESSGTFTE
jgi:Protein of unknown function (DUF2934)